ncbi:DUF4214 domain-containing protein [Duganella sp. FT92W]|uniref:DUF4214 domain-containing protein n=1 Tax=Pseudoduganella rivuli TaxID=2666085 RepID=A0A7X2IQB1_9BURK|nr:Ig-like domain-containing protein [Pseudoduganella rivuli]MRV73970.1 DUF4214 domain-containing protein [Pseudoduganella rivuli]
MAQPSYSSANGYIGESFFTINFDIDLDAVHPPLLNAFNVQVNGTDVTVTGVTIDSTARTAQVTINGYLLAGDIIDFVYTDPSGANDASAIQGLDGTDSASFSHSIVVAIGRPGPSAPPAPTLDKASDSGTLSDHITNDNTPTVSGTSEANATVKLYDTDGTTLLGTTTADGGGNWSLTSGSLGDGSHTLKVTQTNGSSQTSSLSSGLSLTIDTAASAPTKLGVASGSDSGTLGDGISNAGTPAITGTAEANATVQLYDTDGTTMLGTAAANGSGAWSITTSTLTSGSHTLTAKQTDVAGNVSAVSNGFTYVLDTIGPTNMALSTNTVQQTAATNGSTVATLSSTDTTSVTYGFAVGNGVIDADNGKFTISGTSLTAAQNLTAGAYHIYLSATDAAGNDAFNIFTINVTNAPSVSSIVRAASASSIVDTGATSVDYTVTFSQSVTGVDASDFALTATGNAAGNVASVAGSGSTYTVTVNTISGDGTLRLDLNSSATGIQNGSSVAIGGGYTSGESYSLDHTAPSAPGTPAMTAGTDTGKSSSDAITSNTTPVFTGTGEANASVKLYDTDGTTLLGTTTADGAGKWSITSSTLSSGSHTLTVKQSDAAGNTSAASSALTATIDNTAPTAPATPVLSPASDSGTSGDFLTNVTTPVITGASEANATVKLYDTDGTTLLGTTTADGAGKWSITSSTLSSGSHTLTVKQTDVAGNVSKASSGLTLDVDTSVPGTPSTPVLQTASDSGTLGDAVTRITAPTMIGTGTVGDTVSMYDTDGSTVLGTAVVDGSGNWSIASSALADGVHSVTVRQTNAAGTASSASKAFSLTIDATAPGAPGTPAMTAGTDTGKSSSDAITSNTTPVFSGTGEANATVKLYDTDGTTLLGTTTADGAGKWSITSSTLSSGPHTLSVKQTDAAGNTSSSSTTLAVTIDTTANTLAAPVIASASDSGAKGDSLTNVATPTMSGTAEANSAITLYDTDGATVLGTATADGSGAWSITAGKLADGIHTLSARQTDIAGNISAAGTGLALTVDTSVPAAPTALAMSPVSDTGTVGDGITYSQAPQITGSGTPGMTVRLYDTNGTTELGSAVVGGNGAWTITSSILTDGTHTMKAVQTNAAGTASAQSTTLNVTIDNTAPPAPGTPALAPSSDSGALGDGITTDTSPLITGTAAPGAIVSVYDHGALLGTTSANASGVWSFSSSLGMGSHQLQASQTNSVDNTSTLSGTLALTISAPSQAPSALALSASSDSGAAGDGVTNVATPTITGHATPGASITLLDGGSVVGSATANASGAWSITTATLANGAHSLSALATDGQGAPSPASGALAVTIDTQAASAITLSNAAILSNAGANAAVGTLSNNDASTGDQFSYALVAGGGDSDNGAFSIDGNTLRLVNPATVGAGAHTVRVAVTDRAGNVHQQAFSVTVTNPTSQVDGVPVQSGPVTLPGGGTGTEVTVPIVQPGRTDANEATPLADIPLSSNNGTTVLQAHVPVGFGLQSSGGASQPAGSSLEELIAAIAARTQGNAASDQAHLTGNGQQFLQLLPTTVPLLVQTVVVGGTASAAGQPLTLSGTSTASQHTALVIDTAGMGGSGSIVLQQVDFAAVVGSSTVTGSTPGQVLSGDSASQHFIVQSNSGHVLSGGGNDQLQWSPSVSTGRAQQGAPGDIVTPGALLLNGGTGADKVTFAGAQAGYTVVRSDAHVVVTDKASGAQATLANVETLQFSDGALALQSRGELGQLAALYQNILGRQADVSGFEYWGAQQQAKISMGDIALSMIRSAEAAEAAGRGIAFNGNASHDVGLLYQSIFARTADTAGAAYWVDAMQHGARLAQVVNGMLASAEMVGISKAPETWDFRF